MGRPRGAQAGGREARLAPGRAGWRLSPVPGASASPLATGKAGGRWDAGAAGTRPAGGLDGVPRWSGSEGRTPRLQRDWPGRGWAGAGWGGWAEDAGAWPRAAAEGKGVSPGDRVGAVRMRYGGHRTGCLGRSGRRDDGWKVGRVASGFELERRTPAEGRHRGSREQVDPDHFEKLHQVRTM